MINTVSLKFKKNISNTFSDWNKLSAGTVKQMTIFKIEVDHKRNYMP